MTKEQINIAIAEACGWLIVKACDGSLIGKLKNEQGPMDEIPDYCNDLNAMHEAENRLPSDKKEDYWYQLYENCRRSVFSRVEDNYKMLHSTARQRAEAFLRTINKWEGGSDERRQG
jgi:hypothetical protein